MKFCQNCGTQLDDNAVVCPSCGLPQSKNVATNTQNIGWAALGCCIPVAGLILFLVWKDTQPANAKMAGIGALVGFGIGMLSSILMMLVGALA